MGRALLNVPHEVLLEQVVELRNHLRVAEDSRRALTAAGLDGDGLLAGCERGVEEGWSTRHAAALAKVAGLDLALQRSRWTVEVCSWGDGLRDRLALCRSAHQQPLVKVVRAAMPKDRARRFAAAVSAVRATAAALDLHAGSLGGWVAPFLAEARRLEETGEALRAAEDAAATHGRACNQAVERSRATLQALLREARLAWAVAGRAQHAPGPLPPLELPVLERYAAALRQRSAPAAGGSEPDVVGSESDVVGSESDAVGRASGVVEPEWGPVGRELEDVARELRRDGREWGRVGGPPGLPTPLDSSPTPPDSHPSPLDSLPTALNPLQTPLDSLPTIMNSLSTPPDSNPSPLDSRSAPAGPATVIDAHQVVVHTRVRVERRRAPSDPEPS